MLIQAMKCNHLHDVAMAGSHEPPVGQAYKIAMHSAGLATRRAAICVHGRKGLRLPPKSWSTSQPRQIRRVTAGGLRDFFSKFLGQQNAADQHAEGSSDSQHSPDFVPISADSEGLAGSNEAFGPLVWSQLAAYFDILSDVLLLTPLTCSLGFLLVLLSEQMPPALLSGSAHDRLPARGDRALSQGPAGHRWGHDQGDQSLCSRRYGAAGTPKRKVHCWIIGTASWKADGNRKMETAELPGLLQLCCH